MRIVTISIIVLLLAVSIVSYAILGDGENTEPLTAVVQEGKFERFVRGEGSIVATRSVRISCPLSWHAITFIAPEGSYVEKGDVVLKFEREDLEEEVIEDVNRHRTKALKFKEMEQTLEAERHRLKSEIATAKADLEIARLELENLLKRPRPDDLKLARIELSQAEAVLAAAEAEHERVQNPKLRPLMLASEVRSIEKRYARAVKEHQLAKTNLRIVKMGSKAFPNEVEQARLQVNQAAAELKRAKKALPEKLEQLNAAIKRAKADVERRVVILDGSRSELEATIVKSPVDGMVVYRTIHGRKLTRGDKTHRGSDLIDLPELTSMSLRAKVRESDIQYVEEGSRCRIFIDAFPGEQFTGEVTEIGTVAKDSSKTETITVADLRRETGIKVFDVTIAIDEGQEALRPNLLGRAEILIDTIPDALTMPVDAIYERDGKSIVYVYDGVRTQAVPVEEGPRQDDRIVVEEGLDPGMRVCLVQPEETGLAETIRDFFGKLLGGETSEEDNEAGPDKPEEPERRRRKGRGRGRGMRGGRPGGKPGG